MRTFNAKKIEDFLDNGNRTLTDLAAKSRCSEVFLRLLRRGGYKKRMRAITMDSLARALGCRPSDLFVDKPNENPN